MPQRARDRTSLNTSHPVLHYRDDRAIFVSQQKAAHPRDRTRAKASQACKCGYCDYHDRAPVDSFRRARGGRPLEVREDDRRVHAADGGRDNFPEWFEREKRAPKLEVDLWEIARPGRVRRGLPRGYEVIQRPRDVIVLDEEEDEWEDDFELVERPQQVVRNAKGKGKARGGSFAQAVKGKRRER
ncbi:hypothetical protein CALCODRAFT_510687 [Calocera cornea HHB12733]|uniref:Uncharacterized protein n=1 Tax=Calocera cornea HHB12733 TaxID=1353952 RepID=A0A165EBN6_9BASI|nr:hypothetical protein CALCODRAFT_510687 [Calocera cornea HHB12733]